MLIKPQTTNFAKIRVMGIGGGGSNALNSMISQSSIAGIDFIAVNTFIEISLYRINFFNLSLTFFNFSGIYNL